MLKTVEAVVSVLFFWSLYTIYIPAWLKILAHGVWASQPTNTWLLPTEWQSVLQFYPTRQLTREFMFAALVFLGTYTMGQWTQWTVQNILSEKQEAVHW